MLYQVLLVSYLIVALMLIGFVLIQQGKGADMGASFGAGGSNTVFGSSGSGNFMTKTTAVLATCFFVISLLLGTIAANNDDVVDDFDNLQAPILEMPLSSEIPTVITEAPAVSDIPVPAVTEEDTPATEDVPK